MIRRAGPDNAANGAVNKKEAKKSRVSEIVAGACCFALLGCSVAAGGLAVKSYMDYNSKARELQEQTESIVIPQVSEAVGANGVDTLKQELAEMSFRGNEAAALQNRYFKLGEPLTGEAGEAWYAEVEEISSGLSPLFEKNNGANAQWFFPGSEVTEELSWRFEGHYNDPDEELAAVWTLKDSTGSLVAYAAGGYDITDGVFTDVDWHVTTYGNELTAAYMDTYDGEDMYAPDGAEGGEGFAEADE